MSDEQSRKRLRELLLDSEFAGGLRPNDPVLAFLDAHGRDYEGAYACASGMQLVAVLVALGVPTRLALRLHGPTDFDRRLRSAYPFVSLPRAVESSDPAAPPILELCEQRGAILNGISNARSELAGYGRDYRRAYESTSGVTLLAVIGALGGDLSVLRSSVPKASTGSPPVTDDALRAAFPFDCLPRIAGQ